MPPLISTGTLARGILTGRLAVVTGAGRGVGLETARSLAWLGSHVVVAEVDEVTGAEAERLICDEIGPNSATFVQTDVGDEESLRGMTRHVGATIGSIDIVVNNATVTPFGPADRVSLEDWDASYRVNVRGPVELARLTIPVMRERRFGVFVCLSSVGGAFMAPYETMKAAQVELAHTLAAELEDTGVHAFAIGPGQVMTPGLEAGVRKLAPFYRLTAEQFLALNTAQQLTPEQAGAGIAAAIALAERFHGTETSAVAGLTAAGITGAHDVEPAAATPRGDLTEAGRLLRDVRTTFAEQLDGWAQRGMFERTWMERDFRKHVGVSSEDFLRGLDELGEQLHRGERTNAWRDLLPKLRAYYEHYAALASQNTAEADVRDAQLTIIEAWRSQVEGLERALGGK